ncbi:MAG: sulfatase [Thermoanaerobaculia bacterium]
MISAAARRPSSGNLFLLLLALAGLPHPLGAVDFSGPVVIYLVDTLRADRVSPYGTPLPTTPAAERLAAEGVLFENAYSLSSWTRASVSTLLTSQLPTATGAIDRNGVLDPAVPYLPEELKRLGFRTAAFVTNGNIFDPRLGFQRGFDFFQAIAGTVHAGAAYAREAMEPALRFVKGQTSGTFFLYVHVLDPHYLPRASRDINSYDYALEPAYTGLFADEFPRPTTGPGPHIPVDYDRAVRQADDQFGRLVAALKAKGFWNSALVIYTSDHGEEFGEHGGRGHGLTLYEEQIHIPLLVKFPGEIGRKTRRSDLVSLADIVPTIAELAGLSRSAVWIGRSLLSKETERTLYFSEDLDEARLYAARRGPEKLIVGLYPRFSAQTFRLEKDPGETHGVPISCDEAVTPPPGSLARLAAELRDRESASQPALRFEKTRPESIRFDLVVNLGDQMKPFLTTADLCRFSPAVRKSAFFLLQTLPAGEPFRLAFAADDTGQLPRFRLNVLSAETGKALDPLDDASPLRVTKTLRPTLTGPMTDETAANLKSLGYVR